MKYQHILALALGIVAIAACQRENPMADDSRREIKFTATMAGTTKATATAFEEGDQIGLCIGSPVDIDNVLLTPKDDKLVPENKLYWPVDMKQKETAEFIAFYPYVFSTYAYGGFDVEQNWIFAVGSTQYDPEEFALQDYMSAVTTASPSDATVELSFKHLMSRFNLTIVDKLEQDSFRDVQGDSFRSIEVKQIYSWFQVNFAEQILYADPEGGESFSYYPARTGVNSYTLLLAPQVVTPEIIVTLDSGKKMTYVASSPIRFDSGKQVSATLTLREDIVTLTYQIEAWSDDPTTVTFLQKLDGPMPNNEIWYTTSNGEAVNLINTSAFNVPIASHTFAGGKGVITFEDEITAITEGENGRNPFQQSHVKTIRLPESLVTIRAGFEGCGELESIQFASHMAYVPGHLLAHNYNIRYLEFPETDDIATNWSNGPVAFCQNLEKVTGPYATKDNRCLIKNNKLFAFAGAGLKSYTVPDGVTILGAEAFAEYQELEQVNIPESVTEIDYLCFSWSGIKSITIPETVTLIGRSAFEHCSGLKTVHIPNGTDVEANAFEACESLESFTGRFATEDGRCLIKNNALYAFAPAGLKKYTLPEGITSIESGFTYGRGIPSLTLPASLKTINWLWGSAIKEITCLAEEPPTVAYSYSLEELSNLEAIYVPAKSVDAYKQAQYWSDFADKIQAIPGEQPNNEIWYTSTDGNVVELSNTQNFTVNVVSNTYENGKGVMVFDGDLTSVGRFAFNGCRTLASIALPKSVTSIGDAAFQNCYGLPTITIPDGVTVLEEAMFNNCIALEDVELPASLTTIESAAFGSCYSLQTMNIPNSVTTIASDAFLGCTGLESFTGKFASSDNRYLVMDNTLVAFAPCGLDSYTIPSGVTGIGDCAFFECEDLQSLVLPNGLITIGDDAFTLCSSLETLDIPQTVTTIGQSAFARCNSLVSFTGKYATSDGRCLIKDNTLIGFAMAGLTSFAIPDGVTTIGASAFFYCDQLESIAIPSSVKTIEEYAFNRCSGLSEITVLPATPPVAGDYFLSNTGTGPIYVLAASVDAYKAADGWSTYADRIKPLAVVPEAVDLALPSGVKWASFNLGATAPEQDGHLFAWGEVIPNQTGSYKFESEDGFTKYNETDKLTVLEKVDDAAATYLGGGWRMPTHEEFGELRSYCDYAIETVNGVEGYRFTSKNNQNSIFLPFAAKDDWGYSFYWSSTLDTDNTDYPFVYAHTFGLAPEEIYTHNGYGSPRDAHHSIRPVYVSE